ncbi:hypothetical protein SFC43_34930 [Bacteroides sp. CR5/BHMF/2]|nr:hypothetical protein [Bacteroides sp. CR5/BHMF/2]
MKYTPIFTLTALLLLCLTACKQRNHAADATHEEDYIEPVDVIFESGPMLFVQGDNFQYQRANGTYASLGIGFLEIIAEQKPVIPLYRTSLCEEAEDSILLHQYPFDIEMFEAEAEVRKRRHGKNTAISEIVYANPTILTANTDCCRTGDSIINTPQCQIP